MSYLPLALPPGIVRPGTKYDARGRWFDATLVRWHEGAMGPIGGWTRLEAAGAEAVSAAISDDGGVFTDETADANNGTADDVVLIPATPALNDAFYVGFTRPFTAVAFNISTPASDGAIAWEYWNGSI